MTIVMDRDLSASFTEDTKSPTLTVGTSLSSNAEGIKSYSKSAKPTGRRNSRKSASDRKQKRVRKACERCRVKKTKCDGESPCKRCKHDSVVCIASRRMKAEPKQLPRGYAELLEDTQSTLIAIVHTLYRMVKNGESWDLGEVDSNDQGLPVVHDIAEKLGCVRQLPDTPCAIPEDGEISADPKERLDNVEERYGDTPLFKELVLSSRDSVPLHHQQCQQHSYGDEPTHAIDEPELGKGQEIPASNLSPTSSFARPGFQDHNLNLESPCFESSDPWSIEADELLDPIGSGENIEQNILDCYMGFGIEGDMDNIMFGQYEDHGGMNLS